LFAVPSCSVAAMPAIDEGVIVVVINDGVDDDVDDVDETTARPMALMAWVQVTASGMTSCRIMSSSMAMVSSGPFLWRRLVMEVLL